MADAPRLPSSHRKVFAFSAVGVAMVCVPLWQVLQVHGDEYQRLQAERTLLDPVTAAVRLQHGLLRHAPLAARVLGGDDGPEADRQRAAAGVNAQLHGLRAVLVSGAWTYALAEAQQLDADWRDLAQRVTLRALTPPQSDTAHALRIEQTLQVVDLVAVARADAVPEARAWPLAVRALAALPPGAAADHARQSWLTLTQAQALRLDAHLAAARRQAAWLNGIFGALAGLSLLLAVMAWRIGRPPSATPAAPAPGGAAAAPPASRDATQRLLQRLRRRRRRTDAPATAAAAPAAAATAAAAAVASAAAAAAPPPSRSGRDADGTDPTAG